MAKDKKKKNVKKDKVEKKEKKAAKGGGGSTASTRLATLTQNPFVADIVAAALVATATALKDSKRARQLASEAGEELAKLSKAGAEKGNALWDMALEIGRRSLEELTSENAPKRSKSKSASKVRPAKRPPGRSNSR